LEIHHGIFGQLRVGAYRKFLVGEGGLGKGRNGYSPFSMDIPLFGNHFPLLSPHRTTPCYCRRHVRIPTPFSPPFLFPLILSLTSRDVFGASPILRSYLPYTSLPILQTMLSLIKHDLTTGMSIPFLSFPSVYPASANEVISSKEEHLGGGFFGWMFFSLTRRFFSVDTSPQT
jgi:hypothetical protein